MKSKKNNKGFTLVELLAVIVILAVVILIAVTAVIPRMNNAKKKALADEALIYAKAAKEAFVVDGDTGNGTRCYNVSYLNEDYVKKASGSYEGAVVVSNNNNNSTYKVYLTNGKYYIVGNNSVDSSSVTDTKPAGFVPNCANYNPVITGPTNTLGYKLIMNEGESTLQANLDKINQRTASVNFNNIEGTASNSGLYAAEDDEGGTLYYRGNVSNNWVSFGGFYWRIVRINGDGSIRLIYSGTSSNHSGAGTQIGTSAFGDKTSFNEQTQDITGLTSTSITTTYSNGRFANTHVGYMYNPQKVIGTFPQGDPSSSKKVNTFGTFSNLGTSTKYYFFKNFDKNVDCHTGSGTDESGTCTLKCAKLGSDGDSGVDCVQSTWNTLATTSGNYSTSDASSTSTNYRYTSDYKYTCWGNGSAVTKSNSNGTTSVYISCPVVSEIVGTISGNQTQAKVKYHGLMSESAEAAHQNIRDSKIKTTIETWYGTNIYNKKDGTGTNANYLESYLADEIFCNDRTSTTTTFPIASDSSDYLYKAYSRLEASQKAPSYKCNDKRRDGFSLASDSTSIVEPRAIGNGYLKYPVGLITADEAAYAGAKYDTENYNYYLYTGKNYWTLSPHIFNSNYALAIVWYVNMIGGLNHHSSASVYGVRPVINLSSDVLYSSGNGTEGSPYTVTI